MSNTLNIPTDEFPISARLDQVKDPKALMILSHGAGAGMDHSFMSNLAGELNNQDISVLRFNFPYIDQGRRAPDSPKKAQKTIENVVTYAAASLPETPLYVGGKSYGGRMASHCAAQKTIPSVRGLIFYGFPLHAPGRDSKDRAAHLTEVGVPMLFLQGANDKLANINLIGEVTQELDLATLKTFKRGDHSFKVPKSMGLSPEEMIVKLATETAEWIDGLGINTR